MSTCIISLRQLYTEISLQKPAQLRAARIIGFILSMVKLWITIIKSNHITWFGVHGSDFYRVPLSCHSSSLDMPLLLKGITFYSGGSPRKEMEVMVTTRRMSSLLSHCFDAMAWQRERRCLVLEREMEFIIIGKSIISGGREAMVAGTGSWLVIRIHTQRAERQEV